MNKTVTIINKHKNNNSGLWQVIEGEATRSFFDNISDLNESEKNTLLKESAEILSMCGNPSKKKKFFHWFSIWICSKW